MLAYFSVRADDDIVAMHQGEMVKRRIREINDKGFDAGQGQELLNGLRIWLMRCWSVASASK